MIRAAVAASADLSRELGGTALFRRNVERVAVSGFEDIRRFAESGRVDVVVVDSTLPGAAALVAALRRDPSTRSTAIVALVRREFGLEHLDLLEAGANAALPLPPDGDWDDRLMRLIHVPARRATRFAVDIAVEGGRGTGLTFTGRAVNLSVHGILLECPQILEVGEDLRFSFVMPGVTAVICGTGTVVRSGPQNRFGVELTHVEGDGRVQIKRYVEAG